MKQGKYKEGEKVLRAKISFDHPNTTLRDPAIYRVNMDIFYKIFTYFFKKYYFVLFRFNY